MDDSKCMRCKGDKLRDYPVCVGCEPKAHFTHRTDCKCADCTATVAEITRVFADDTLLMVDVLDYRLQEAA